MPAESLRFDAVTKRFDDTVAVDGVSATIPAGQFVALVGASGSGKSTLLKTVNRLVEPSDGRVLIDDADVATRPAPALRRSIGYVFQSIGLFPHMTVAENIAIGPRIAGGPPVDVPALLDLVALPRELAGRRPYALSGGQRQRLAIARAILADPRILILDEATSSLDSQSERLIQSALFTLVRERTTFVIAHRLSTIQHADLILVLERGQISAAGTHADLMQSSEKYQQMVMMQTAIPAPPKVPMPATPKK